MKRLLLGFLMVIVNCANAQNVFWGIVHDTDSLPIPGARIHIHETNAIRVADANGQFRFEAIKQGTYHIHVTSIGYHAYTATIQLIGEPVFHYVEMQVSVNQLHEVVIESSALKNNQEESSLLLEQVNEEFINKQAGSTLMETLATLPGINAMNMGVGISKPMIRGMHSNRVMVTDNGIKQEGQQWAQDHGLEIDQHNVESIEVVKGPASLAYGSDAMGGVIAIKHPSNMMEGDHKSKLSYIHRNNNNTNGISAYAKGNAKGVYYNARITGLEYSDYRVPADSFVYETYRLPIYNNRLKNTAGKELHTALTAGINRNWGYSHLTFSQYNQQVGVFSGAVGIPREYQLTPDGSIYNIDLPNQKIRHTKVISNNNIKINKNWLELDLGFQHNFRGEYTAPHSHGAPLEDLNEEGILLNLYTYNLNARYHIHTNKKLKSTVGIQAGYMRNEIGGWEFVIPAYDQQQAGLFYIQEWTPNEHWFLNAGLRLEGASQQIEASDYPFYHRRQLIDVVNRNEEINRNYLNYAYSFGVSFIPKEAINIKLNAGKTYRVPTPIELGSNGPHHGAFRYEVGDAILNPEEGYQFDLAVVYEHKRLDFFVSPYFNMFQNYIYLQPTGSFARVEINDRIYPYPSGSQVYQYQQGAIQHMGYEYKVSYKVLEWMYLETSGDYVYMINRTNSEFIPFTPPQRWMKSIRVEKNRKDKLLTSIYGMFQHSDYYAQNSVARNELATAGYSLVDIGGGVRIRKNKFYTDINLQVRNLLNENYLNHLSRYRLINIPEQGRNFLLNLTFYFDKMGR